MKEQMKTFILEHKRDIAIAASSAAMATVIVVKLADRKYANAIDYRLANEMILRAYHPELGTWLNDANAGKIMQIKKA